MENPSEYMLSGRAGTVRAGSVVACPDGRYAADAGGGTGAGLQESNFGTAEAVRRPEQRIITV